MLASYQMALRDGHLPFMGSSEWHWYAAYAFCLFAGAVLVYSAMQSWRFGLVAIGIYAPLMAIGLLIVSVVVSFAMGDSL